MRVYIFIGIALVISGCSKNPEPKIPEGNAVKITTPKESVFLGERLLATAVSGVDGKTYAPSLEKVQNSLTECKFSDIGGGYHHADCEFQNSAPGRGRKTEKLSLYLTAPYADVIAIDVDQKQLDFEMGLSLFDKLKGLKITELSCPDIEIKNMVTWETKFYQVASGNNLVAVYREVSNGGGSGGNSKDTTIYFGIKDPPCVWSIENNQNIDKAKVGANRRSSDGMAKSNQSAQSSRSCVDMADAIKCGESSTTQISSARGSRSEGFCAGFLLGASYFIEQQAPNFGSEQRRAMMTTKSLLFDAGTRLTLQAIAGGSFTNDGDAGRNYAKSELSGNPMPFFDTNTKVHKDGLNCLKMQR